MLLEDVVNSRAMINVSILGAGNIGHALGAFLGSRVELKVTIWGKGLIGRERRKISAYSADGTHAIGLAHFNDELASTVKGATIIFLTVPTYAYRDLLMRISKYIDRRVIIVGWEGTGYFEDATKQSSLTDNLVIGLQKSPILCRTQAMGESVEILGLRKEVLGGSVIGSNPIPTINLLNNILPTRIKYVPDYRYISLSPGNPILHPARLYSFYKTQPDIKKRFFYADWNDLASELLIVLFKELTEIRNSLGMKVEFFEPATGSGNLDPKVITQKVKQARTLAGITLPHSLHENEIQIDFMHRFFREDIGQGLAYISMISAKSSVKTPNINSIVEWYQKEKICA